MSRRRDAAAVRGTVPDVVVRRLVLYLRILQDIDAKDRPYISSKELGELAGISPPQVRKDLAVFGEFGKQGVGYDIDYLREELRDILHVNRAINIVLVGAGDLGVAISRYNLRRFARERNYPFRLVAIFDNDPAKIGRRVENKVEIRPVEELGQVVAEMQAAMAIITVPASAAQAVADTIVRAGIKAILNFAPVKLKVPPDVRLHYSDVALEMEQLAFYLPQPATQAVAVREGTAGEEGEGTA